MRSPTRSAAPLTPSASGLRLTLMSDLGRLLWTERVRRRWTRLVFPLAVGLPLAYWASRNALIVLSTAAICMAILLISQRIRLDVRERGVVVVGFFAKRNYRWSEITAFSPMPLSTGSPGSIGSVVVDGVNHEILALGEPGLYGKLRELNGLLELSRVAEGAVRAPAPPDGRRSDFTRRRLTLWLGPGAAWWPRGTNDAGDSNTPDDAG